MADKYLYNASGEKTERELTVVSTGAAEAGDGVALDSAGKLDVSVMPVGVGPETMTVPAFEDLVDGNFINVYVDASGNAQCRKADASNKRLAHGFVLANVTAPANATIYGPSNINTSLTGQTIGSRYYLSGTTPGAGTATAPSTAAWSLQYLHTPHSATASIFHPDDGITLA